VQVGFSSATAGNVDWTGDSVAGSFEEAGTNEDEDTSGAEPQKWLEPKRLWKRRQRQHWPEQS